jgi:hypothetical protein
MDKQAIKGSVKQISDDVKNLSKKLGNLSVTGQGQSKSARKRRRRRFRQASLVDTRTMSSVRKDNSILATATDTGLRRLRTRLRPPTLTDQGVSFLKCAFAPPDFQANSLGGFPDSYRGPSLVRKHRYVNSTSFAVANDYYIILAPVPGVAYFITNIGANLPIPNTQVWTAVLYTDFASMFGTGQDPSQCVTKFRYISNHIELIPTVNQMTWSGQIQSWKIPLALELRQGGANTTNLWSITGLDGVNTTMANQYTSSYIMGFYGAAYSSNPEVEFQTIIDNTTAVPSTIITNDFGQLNSPSGFPGLDNGFESLLLKVSGVVGSNETAIIKTWACVEYQINPSHVLSEFQTLSPCDPVAVELYREIILGLPIGVPFDQNDSFWNRVLQIVNQLSGLGVSLPGQWGALSRGVNILSGVGLSLTR